MTPSSETLPSFRSRFLWFVAWGSAAAFVLIYLLPMSGILLSIPAAVIGMGVGLGMALLLIFKYERMRMPPLLWGGSVVIGIGLFWMLVTLIIQIPLIPLPLYFSPDWVFYPSAVGAGWLLGVGLPLLCFGAVSAGYRLLE
jgi:hypothetical protein